MKTLLFLMLSPFILFSQIQIGEDIEGLAIGVNAGYSVSTSNNGKIIAVGSPGYDSNIIGYVRVFENNDGNWIQLGETIYGEHEGDHFGSSVSLSADGTIIAIGGPDNEETSEIAGHVKVYENIGGNWIQLGEDIDGEAEGVDGKGFPINVRFGASLSLSNDGTLLAITKQRGGTWEAFYGRGDYAHIYKFNSGVWTQIGDYINTGISFSNDISISSDGNFVALSGRGDGIWPSGQVVVYKNSSGTWTQVGDMFFGEPWVNFLSDVSLSNNGSRIAIGGGITRVYDYINYEWVQEGEDIEIDPNLTFNCSVSLSVDGSTLIAGDGRHITKIYKNNTGYWIQKGEDINEEGSGNYYNPSLELSNDGSTLIVGAPLNDGNGEDAGHTRVFDLSDLLNIVNPKNINAIIYPNPAQNEVNIQIGENQVLKQIQLYNNLGQLIKTSYKNSIVITSFKAGIYFLKIETDQGITTEKLIIKN